MITEFWQLISCENSTKSEIPFDHTTPRARRRAPAPRTALTVTTHHKINGISI
jgi:hypothetical protein